MPKAYTSRLPVMIYFVIYLGQAAKALEEAALGQKVEALEEE